MIFNAITKKAVTEAMENPREIDAPLVEAYLARRALDYLVGFNLSPGALAQAARARSRRAACSRSACASSSSARWRSRPSIRANTGRSRRCSRTPRGQEFEARLTTLAGKKLDKYDLANETQAEMAVQAVAHRALYVTSVEAKPARAIPRRPS